MRISKIAIFALTAVTVADFTRVAIAAPNPQPATKPPVSDVVVPVEETTATPTPQSAIAPPQNQTTPQFTPKASPKQTPANSNDLAVTATDVQVVGAGVELQQIIRSAIRTRPGGDTSQSQLQNDVESILATGLFADARVNTQSAKDGLRVVYQVQPVVVRSLQLSGATALTPAVANDLFKSQLGAPVSPTALRQGAQQLNQWYNQNGYAVAQVLAVRPNNNGVVTVEVAEGIVGSVKIRFIDKDGKPTKGRTQESFLTRDLKLKPGQVFHTDVVQQDLQQLGQLGLFDKADVSLNGDARNVEVSYNLLERPARSANAGGGYSGESGLYGTVTYRDANLGGVNQQLGFSVQASTRDLQFDGRLTNPYRASDPNSFGYSINGFRRRGLSQTFDDNVTLANGDQAREGQFGGGITFSRPVDEWQASVGLNYTRTSIRDREGNVSAVDKQGNQLSFSKNGIDDLVTVSAGVSRDKRDNPVNPTQGSIVSFSAEQSVPIGMGNIAMNRVQANYSQYVPVGLINNSSSKDVFAFNVQGGTTIGDLPPYQAFNLGGINSVRGYGTNQLASGRSYVLATAEYRFPILNPVGGVVFADFGSDLGTSATVPGQPGVVRGKPGSGFGYGAGVRVESPLGIIRADYGINNQGESRLQLGVGQRF